MKLCRMTQEILREPAGKEARMHASVSTPKSDSTPRERCLLHAIAVGAVLVVSHGVAWSQDSLIQFGNGVSLRSVDQGTADMGPLAQSARLSRVDLRMPMGFDRVYRVQSETIGEGAPARYARVSGALIAIFPRSEYQMTERGTSIMVPAGTVYAIGADSAAKVMASQQASSAPQPPPTGLRESTRVDTRVEMRAESSPMRVDTSVDWSAQAMHTTPPAAHEAGVWPTGEAVASVPKSLWTDEQYRAARIAALLDHAGD